MVDLNNRVVGSRPEGSVEVLLERLAELHARVRDHLKNGKLLKAQSSAQEALKLDAENPETMHLMAAVSVAASQLDHAVEWASRAIRKDPQPAYLATLGAALLNAGRFDEALRVFDKAVQLEPNDAELWRRMADALIQARRTSEALLCFRRVLELDPRNADAAYKVGHILHGMGQFAESLVHLDLSASLQPDHAPTLGTRALVLNDLGRAEEAIADCRRAAELNPKSADALNNLGALLRARGRLEEALSAYDRSLRINPNAGRTIFHRASVLSDLGRLDEAMAAYKRSATVGPDHAKAAWNLALLQMLTGDFKRGWKGMEARWEVPGLGNSYPPLPGPKWLGGGDVAGKTILICADEGLGDAIQLVRYIPMLAARGARVVLVVRDALCPLFSGVAGVSQCLPGSSGAQLPAFDLHCPLSSLPLIFGTRLETIPAAFPYLPAPPRERIQAWEGRLGPRALPRVGLVWSGNPGHLNDHNRSVPLHMLTSLLDEKASFVSLQKEIRPVDRAELSARADVFDATEHLVDFGETAALISCLDLVITVDTSVAHLSAALGKPTWILLPYMPDYRWLLDRQDSPWYPSVRLFRQSQSRDYGSVISLMRESLGGWLAEHA